MTYDFRMPQRPDDSGEYDDETLLAVIAERFEDDADDITRRDVAWLVHLAGERLAITRKRMRPDVPFVNCECAAPRCVCYVLVPLAPRVDLTVAILCASCCRNSHLAADSCHFAVGEADVASLLACPPDCVEHT